MTAVAAVGTRARSDEDAAGGGAEWAAGARVGAVSERDVDGKVAVAEVFRAGVGVVERGARGAAGAGCGGYGRGRADGRRGE
jgi:hypothetical protein